MLSVDTGTVAAAAPDRIDEALRNSEGTFRSPHG